MKNYPEEAPQPILCKILFGVLYSVGLHINLATIGYLTLIKKSNTNLVTIKPKQI